MRIALGQLNPIVGDISGNAKRISDCIARAVDAGADLVVFGELSVVGYPPRDLLRKRQFVADSVAAVEALAGHCRDIAALVGFVRPTPGESGRAIQNAAALLADGEIKHVHVKSLLPTYDVFDETRYFQVGPKPKCVEIAGCKVGISICEDIWDAVALGRELYGTDPIAMLSEQGARIVVNMAASPFQSGKAARREELFKRQADRSGATIVYVNQVGGNDELVFDGASCVVSPGGEVIARAASFEEDLLVVDVPGQAPVSGSLPSPLRFAETSPRDAHRREELDDRIGRLAAALKLGLRDYVRKCGFTSVVLGLSGGIDSAVVATLAADAIGAENVLALAMPSRYSSDHSLADAEALAGNLGINYQVIPIEPMHSAFEQAMTGAFSGGRGESAAENIQARIRGNLVMAASNALGHLPLATGNKSELATGYCTLYGDMCGGLAPIGDVLKTDVYRLADRLNAEAGCERIPAGTITKAPSAELKPNQVDQDKLPPYDLLDEILRRYLEADEGPEEIVAAGLDAPTVRRVVRMVDAAEFKRRQSAPTLKVTPRAFGTGRRMPIAQRYSPPN